MIPYLEHDSPCMAKLDRLGWTAGLAFTAYGAHVGVRTNDIAALERVRGLLPIGAAMSQDACVDELFSLYVAPPSTRPGRRNFHLLYDGSERMVRTLELDKIFPALENYFLLSVGYLAEGYAFVHAGVVELAGRAILIPGRSHSGKSTLVKALLDAGATYFSDEMAILDGEGYVHPYPLELALRTAEGVERRTAEGWGSQAGARPLRAGMVVVTQYAEGAAWRPRELTPARGVMALLDNTVSARRNPQATLPILHRAVANARMVKSKRGDAAATVEWITRSFGTDDG